MANQEIILMLMKEKKMLLKMLQEYKDAADMVRAQLNEIDRRLYEQHHGGEYETK